MKLFSFYRILFLIIIFSIYCPLGICRISAEELDEELIKLKEAVYETESQIEGFEIVREDLKEKLRKLEQGIKYENRNIRSLEAEKAYWKKKAQKAKQKRISRGTANAKKEAVKKARQKLNTRETLIHETLGELRKK